MMGTVNFGGSDLTSVANQYDIFVARYDATMVHQWSDNFGDGTQDQFIEDVAVDNAGNVVLVGRIRGAVDFGCGLLISQGNRYDIAVVKLDPSGTCLWNYAYGDGLQDQYGESVAVDSTGNVILTGSMRGTLDFGGGSRASVGPKYDLFVVKLSGGGVHQWSYTFGDGTTDQWGEDVAVDDVGSVVFVGRMRGSLDFGGGADSSEGACAEPSISARPSSPRVTGRMSLWPSLAAAGACCGPRHLGTVLTTSGAGTSQWIPGVTFCWWARS
jgi:hypothetical protein